MRCRHGFESATVQCPQGCHGPVAKTVAASRKSTRSSRQLDALALTNQQIVDAIQATGNLQRAANKLNISNTTIRNRARHCVAIRMALEDRDAGFRVRGSGKALGAALDGKPVLETLQAAECLRSAVGQLQTSRQTLDAFCQLDPKLHAAYCACRKRGRLKAAATRNRHTFLQTLPSDIRPAPRGR